MNDRSPNPRLRPVIRVFVSSTFSDMRHERNALQKDVFPKLELLCQKSGFQFQAIDLRWGVSSEAGLDHRTMRICLEELRRAQEISPEPNFLVLLGDRYGWRPLPEEISQAEFDTLVAAAESGGAGQSPITGTHGKTARQVLEDWYRCDANVLLSDPPEIGPDRAALNFILQPRTRNLGDGRDYTRTKDDPPKDTQDWLDVQQGLWRIINAAFPAEALDHRFENIDWTRRAAEVCDQERPKRAIPQIARFQASATEQEIWGGALSAPNAARHVLAFFREIENGDKFSPVDVKEFFDRTDAGDLDEAAAARQTALKTAIRLRLGADAVGPIPFSQLTIEDGKVHVAASREDTEQFCKSVEDRLRSIIERQIEQYWHPPQRTSVERTVRELEIEQQEHARIARERGGAATFVGRADKLKAIREYLSDEATSPLVLHGASGCGKTALMARAAQAVGFDPSSGGLDTVRAASDTEVGPPGRTETAPIVRFLGTTPRSSDLRGLLTSLCQELRLRWPREGELPTDIKLLEVELHDQFKKATVEQPLLLFLDALDQLADTDGGRNLHWIPIGPLPAHVKLVVSCLSDRAEKDPAGQPYAELQRRQIPATQFVNLDAFSEDEARTLLFERWLPQAGRTVSRDQRARIDQRLASPTSRQPIYLKLLFEEARLWRSYDATPELGEGVPALLKQLFDRLSRPTNHGPLLVERVLGYLAASREGLAENEILKILFRDPEYKAKLEHDTTDTRHEMPPNATRIPIAIWSRLRFDLASYLTERAAAGANVLTYYHRQVAEWVQENLANAPEHHWQPHPLLAEYFRDQADPVKDQSWKGDSPRPFLQVVFHMVGAEQSDEYCQTLCDLRFVEARCRLGQVFELIADHRLAQENLPEAQADMQEERAREARVRRWTTEIIDYAQAWNGRRDKQSRGDAVIDPEPRQPATIRSLEPWSDERMDAEWRRSMEQSTRRDRLNSFADFVVSQSPLLVEYGIHNGFVVQHARNEVPGGPVSTAAESLIPSVLSPLLLRQWGEDVHCDAPPALLRTLIGHKMPIACLSATPDGSRAVSGSLDGTLQVWDLTNGKCLHTIKQQESFINSLSITADGRRAITANSDGNLCFWDLDQGVCLQVLRGHDSSVQSVALTPDGQLAVSAGTDSSLRVWKPDAGKSLHVLTAREVSSDSVAVTPDGRYAVSGALTGLLQLWDVHGEACLRSFDDQHGAVAVWVAPNGKQAVVRRNQGGGYFNIELVALDGGTSACSLEGRGEIDIKALSVTPDGKYALLGWGKSLVVADMEAAAFIRDLKGHTDDVTGVCITADGHRAISCAHDGTIRIWRWIDRAMGYVLTSHSTSVGGVAITPDGTRAVSVGGNRLRLWDVGKNLCLQEYGIEALWEASCVGVTPDGKLALCGYWNGRWEAVATEDDGCYPASDRIGPVLGSQRCGYRQAHITPDGRRAILVGVDHVVEVWDVESGVCLRMMGEAAPASVTPDGLCVLTGGPRGEGLQLWNLVSGECIRSFGGQHAGERWLSIMPGGYLAVSGDGDGKSRVWDLRTGICLITMDDGAANRPDFLFGGQYMICEGARNTLELWQMRGREDLGIYAQLAGISAFAASHHADIVCVGDENGIVRFLHLHGLPKARDKAFVAAELVPTESHESILQRGLQHSTDHRFKLAHLVALAVHCEQSGESGEARSLGSDAAELLQEIMTAECGNQRTAENVKYPDMDFVLQERVREVAERLLGSGPSDTIESRTSSEEISQCDSERQRDTWEGASIPEPASLDGLRNAASDMMDKGLFDAAASTFEKLLAAGDPIESIGPNLVKCLLNIRSAPMATDLTRAREIITAIEESGRIGVAAELRTQMAAKCQPTGRTSLWHRMFRGKGGS